MQVTRKMFLKTAAPGENGTRVCLVWATAESDKTLVVWSEPTSVEVTPHRQEGQVQAGVAHSGVGLKDGSQGQLHEHQEQWMFPGRHSQNMTSTSWRH